MTTGELIKAARKEAGMTQAGLAEKLGISAQSVAQWENDLRNPKLDTLQKIADALSVPVGLFMLNSNELVTANRDAELMCSEFLGKVTPHLKRACDMDRRIDAKRGYDPGAAVDLVPKCRFFESMVLGIISSSVNKLSEDIKLILDAGEFGMDKKD